MKKIEKTTAQNDAKINFSDSLLNEIIERSSNVGDTVLDCFMGSGSTGVACVNTGRNFIGIELDEGYFNIAKKRIEEAVNDLP